MSQEVHYFYIQPNGPRPDYRLFIAFLWHEGQNVDSDGDSYNPASKDWTYLFLCNRENEAEHMMISPVIREDAPKGSLILEVKSGCDYLAARCAYFLAVSTRSGVSEKASESAYHPAALAERIKTEFDVEAAMQRVENSPFSHSTLENPYPNLPHSTS